MNKDFTNSEDELDRKIREKYLDHSIDPDNALWENINARLTERTLLSSQHQVRWLKAASVVLVLGFLALLTNQLFWHEGKHNTELAHPSPDSTPSTYQDTGIPENHQSEQKDSSRKSLDHKTEYNTADSESIKPILGQGIENVTSQKQNRDRYDLGRISENGQDSDHTSLQNGNEATDQIIPSDFSSHPIDLIAHRKTEAFKIDFKPGTFKKLITSLSMNSSTHLMMPDSTKSRPKKKWFVETYGAPLFSYRALSANPELGQVPNYSKSYFNSRESPQIAWSFGLNGGYSISDKLWIKSGLSFSRYSLKFKTDGQFLVKKNDSEYLLYTSYGETSVSLTGTDTISEETMIKSSISLNYISLPVIMEYRIFNHTSLSLGFNLEYLHSQDLNWQSSDENINADQQINGISGIRSTTLSLALGFVREQPIFKHMSVMINPTFSSHVKPLSNSSPVRAYPNSLSIRLGLRKYF